MTALIDIRMRDGSRHFRSIPITKSWYVMGDTVEQLDGAQLTGFRCDHVTEAWIDFTYLGQEFSINDQFGDYWFFVKDPACPDEILTQVLSHF